MRLPNRVVLIRERPMNLKALTALMILCASVFGLLCIVQGIQIAEIKHQNTKLRFESRLKTAAITALELTIEARNEMIASCRSQGADDAMNIIQLKAVIAQNEANNLLLATARELDWGVGWYVEEAFAGPMSTIVVKGIPGMKKRNPLPDVIVVSLEEKSLQYRSTIISDGAIYSLTDADPPPT